MYKKFLIVFFCFLLVGCNEKSNKNLFKDEYEKYNGKYVDVELENTDIIEYSNVDNVNELLKSGTGVVLVSNPKDDVSRVAVSVLLEAAGNTDLDKIIYIDSLDGIDGVDNIDNIDIPLVLFILDGKVMSYHVGTIDKKVDLDEDEHLELYNTYLEGIHQVLQDACDESC